MPRITCTPLETLLFDRTEQLGGVYMDDAKKARARADRELALAGQLEARYDSERAAVIHAIAKVHGYVIPAGGSIGAHRELIGDDQVLILLVEGPKKTQPKQKKAKGAA